MELIIAIDENDVLKSRPSVYDLENSILYKMCKENFAHDSIDKILAKTIIIGRTYAVSLDRGKDKGKEKEMIETPKYINDDFYQKIVVPLFLESDIDINLSKLKDKKMNLDSAREILELHCELTESLKGINKQNKRSFSSKYLHFHLPNLFFLYDSRASSAITKIVKSEKHFKKSIVGKVDKVYAAFFYKALYLKTCINEKFYDLSPRQLDNYLLISANEHLRKKIITKNKNH